MRNYRWIGGDKWRICWFWIGDIGRIRINNMIICFYHYPWCEYFVIKSNFHFLLRIMQWFLVLLFHTQSSNHFHVQIFKSSIKKSSSIFENNQKHHPYNYQFFIPMIKDFLKKYQDPKTGKYNKPGEDCLGYFTALYSSKQQSFHTLLYRCRITGTAVCFGASYYCYYNYKKMPVTKVLSFLEKKNIILTL